VCKLRLPTIHGTSSSLTGDKAQLQTILEIFSYEALHTLKLHIEINLLRGRQLLMQAELCYKNQSGGNILLAHLLNTDVPCVMS